MSYYTESVIRFFKTSGNAKTGRDVSVTYSSRRTCPTSCPLRGREGGCFGENLHCSMVWNTCDTNKALSLDQLESAVQKLPAGRLLRHNVAGDVAIEDTSNVNGRLVNRLTAIYKNVRAWSYSHCIQGAANLRKLAKACAGGFVINASCERVADCDRAAAAGVPAVLVVESFETMPRRTPRGIKIIPCPAQIHEHKTCSTCTNRGPLCQNAKRGCVMAFEAHGQRAARARASIRAANAQ